MKRKEKPSGIKYGVTCGTCDHPKLYRTLEEAEASIPDCQRIWLKHKHHIFRVEFYSIPKRKGVVLVSNGLKYTDE